MSNTPSNMRVVFMGTPDFAVASLRSLVAADINVVAVITAPDRPAGRGQKLRQSAVKEAALELDIPVLQPVKLKAPEFLDELKAYAADLQVVVAFRMLPEVVWNMPPRGTINLHGSLLPQYRGAAPINRAIMNGERETGVTTFFIRKEIDTGHVIDRAVIPITPDDTAGTLHDRMMDQGAALLTETVKLIATGEVEAIPQEEMKVGGPLHDAPKIFRDDCRIAWDNPQDRVYNHVRGLIPYPAPYTELVGPEGERHQVKIHGASPVMDGEALAAGAIRLVSRTEMHVGTSTLPLQILSLQMAGKKRMDVASFLNGFTIAESWHFE